MRMKAVAERIVPKRRRRRLRRDSQTCFNLQLQSLWLRKRLHPRPLHRFAQTSRRTLQRLSKTRLPKRALDYSSSFRNRPLQALNLSPFSPPLEALEAPEAIPLLLPLLLLKAKLVLKPRMSFSQLRTEP